VATVLGKPLPLSLLKAIESEAAPANTVEGLVRLGVGAVLAADEARRVGVVQEPGESAWEHVKRFLARIYNPATTCRNLSDEDVGASWKLHRRSFVHPDIFEVVDVQLICCPKGRAPCVDDPEVDACFHRGIAESERVFASLVSASQSKESFLAAAEVLVLELPGLGVVEYTFAYDFDFAPHEQPGKWVVLDPRMIAAVKGAKDGDLLAPVKSAYGYHILRVLRRQTKSMGSPDDPEVRSKLRGRVCDTLVDRTRWRYLEDLTTHVHFEMSQEAVPTVEGWLAESRSERKKGTIPLKVHGGGAPAP